MSVRRLLTRCAPALAVLLVAVPAASAFGSAPTRAGVCTAFATKTWDGGAGTNSWSAAANWAPDGIPGQSDLVCIPASTGLTVTYASGTTSIASLESDGPLQVSGGTLNITSRARPSQLRNLKLLGGTIGGSADLLVVPGGHVLWAGGSISSVETNPGTLTISGPKGSLPGASLTISSSTSVTLGGARVLRNQGTTTWSSGDVDAQATASGHPQTTFDNEGMFTVTNASDPDLRFQVSGSGFTYPRFVNEAGATVSQTADSGGHTWFSTGTENYGSVDVDGGLLMMGGAFNMSPPVDTGSYSAAPGTTLYVAGRRTVAGSISAPSATVELAQDTITGSYSAETTKILDDTRFDAAPQLMRRLRIESFATLDLDVNEVFVDDVVLNHEYAVLGGRANIIIPPGGTVNCLDGTIDTSAQSPGTLVLAGPAGDTPGAVFEVHGLCGLDDSRRLANHGILHVFSYGSLTERGDPPVPQIANDGAILLDGGSIWGTVENAPGGTVQSTQPGQHISQIQGRFENDGTVNVVNGRLDVGYSGSVQVVDGGDYFAAPGTTLGLNGPRIVNGDVSATGADVNVWSGTEVIHGRFESDLLATHNPLTSVSFDNPDTTVNAVSVEGTLDFNIPSITVQQLDSVLGGTLGGTGEVILPPGGVANLARGRLTGALFVVSAGSESTPAARLNLGAANVDSGFVLKNYGDVELTGGIIQLSGTGTAIENYAEMNNVGTASATSIWGSASTTFHNFAGGELIDDATTPFEIQSPFINDGLFDVQAGTLELRGSSSAVSAGAFVAHPAATLRFASPNATLASGASVVDDGRVEVSSGSLYLDPGVPVQGTGALEVSAGNATLSGVYGMATTDVSGGSLTLNGASQTGELDLSGGVLGGTGTLELQEAGSSWTAGRMADAGTTRIAPGATLAIGGSGTKILAGGRTLENEGSVTWAGTSVGSDQGATILNDSGALVDMQGNSQMHVVAGPPATLTNAAGATLRKSGGNTEALFEADFENAGSAEFAVASIRFTSPAGIANSGTMTVDAGATVRSTGAIQNDGVLAGDGTIAADVVSPGEVRPGDSPGILTVSGGYSQATAGRLRIDIAGTDPGTGYDRLVVTGTAALEGTLTIDTASGFEPVLGTTFEILDGARSGQFSSVEGSELPSGFVYRVYYDDAAVRLVVEQSSRPAASRGTG
jgi:fibronectin-binding autotransporter adhesin